MENMKKNNLYESVCACVFQQLMLTSIHWWDCWTVMATDCTMTQNSLHVAPDRQKHRLEWRPGEGQEPEWGQTFGVTGTEGGIKQKSERNRPRYHVAEGAHPGALPNSLKADSSVKQAVLFHHNLRQPRPHPFSQNCFVHHLLCYLEVAHRSLVNNRTRHKGGGGSQPDYKSTGLFVRNTKAVLGFN